MVDFLPVSTEVRQVFTDKPFQNFKNIVQAHHIGFKYLQVIVSPTNLFGCERWSNWMQLIIRTLRSLALELNMVSLKEFTSYKLIAGNVAQGFKQNFLFFFFIVLLLLNPFFFKLWRWWLGGIFWKLLRFFYIKFKVEYAAQLCRTAKFQVILQVWKPIH